MIALKKMSIIIEDGQVSAVGLFIGARGKKCFLVIQSKRLFRKEYVK